MRERNVSWERAREVRDAARAWREAGAVGPAVVLEVDARYPDPRVLPSTVLRVLTFVFSSIAAVAAASFGAIVLKPQHGAAEALAALLGAACLAASEALDASPRWTARGAVGALSSCGIGALLLATGMHLDRVWNVREALLLDSILGAAAALFLAASHRWGIPADTVFGLAALFLLASRAPAPWAVWFAAGLAGTAALHARLDRDSWAPSHRLAAAAGLAVCLTAAYAAVNVWVLDTGGIASLLLIWGPRDTAPAGVRPVAIALTALLPVAVLGWGLATRRRLLIALGAVFLSLSFVTLRHYVALAPLWVILISAGLVLAGLGFLLERFLKRVPGGEWRGYTAAPLFSGEGFPRGLDWVPVAAAFAPAAPQTPAREEGFTGQGGTFGGGGASGTF